MTDYDDRTIERLRAMADRMDPVPDAVTELARVALSSRRIDEALAELVADSANESAAVARGEPMRLLSFTHGAVAIELQVHAEDGTAALRGLVSGATGEVVLQTPGRERRVPIDESGWFTADGLPTGLLRLRLRAGDAPVTTSWVTI